MIPLYDDQPRYSAPSITMLLIAMNVVFFLFELQLEGYSRNHFVSEYGIVPLRITEYGRGYGSLITSMFLHGGFMHLIGNMWFLWIFGDNIEDYLGHTKYVVFYLLCGLAAGLAHIYTNPDSRVPTIGASGAIAGVMGAYAVKFPMARVHLLIFIFIFITTADLPAIAVLLYWFVLQLFSGFGSIVYSNASQGGVAFMAHAGGFVAGMLLIHLLGGEQRLVRRRDYNW